MRSFGRALTVVCECLRSNAGDRSPGSRPRASDWTAALEFANRHWITSAIYAELRDSGALNDVPGDVADYLGLVHRLNGERNHALRRQSAELLRALSGTGIRPMLLKGALALFTDLYRDPAARMIRDIDVLVPRGSEDEAAAALHRLGYRLATKYEEGHNAYGDFERPNDPGAVDLHVELIETSHLLPAAEVWSRARRGVHVDCEFYAPSATDAMLHHLLHAQIHYLGNFYRGVIELRQVYEFAQLVRQQAGIDWAEVESRFDRDGLRLALESYALTAGKLFDVPWPLSRPPSWRAVAHCRRCLVQTRIPALMWASVPLANIRSAFAGHRMRNLYAREGSQMALTLRHAVQFLKKRTPHHAIGRLFRVQ